MFPYVGGLSIVSVQSCFPEANTDAYRFVYSVTSLVGPLILQYGVTLTRSQCPANMDGARQVAQHSFFRPAEHGSEIPVLVWQSSLPYRKRHG